VKGRKIHALVDTDAGLAGFAAMRWVHLSVE
jgi:hypothetical protein